MEWNTVCHVDSTRETAATGQICDESRLSRLGLVLPAAERHRLTFFTIVHLFEALAHLLQLLDKQSIVACELLEANELCKKVCTRVEQSDT